MARDALIQLRRDTAANWASVNPVLASGEGGYETDTNKLKIGDGSTAWTSLAYIGGGSGSAVAVSDTKPTSPTDGMQWFDSATGIIYIYINDGSSSQWVEQSSRVSLTSEQNTRLTAAETNISTLQTQIRPVNLGGTGASTLTSGSYLKGAGTSAITTQAGIPATDITSGSLPFARMPSGSVLQVQHGTLPTTFSSSSTETWTDITNYNVSITPKFSNSKILVMLNIGSSSGTNATLYRVLRNGSTFSLPNTDGSRKLAHIRMTNQGTDTNHADGGFAMTLVDTPGSTSALTYQVQFLNEGAGNHGTLFAINRNNANVDSGISYQARSISTITVMEIAG